MRVKEVVIAALAGFCAGTTGAALAQKAPAPSEASMARPPQPPASGASATNPDNMPIKRSTRPTNDPMSHAPPPASGAIPK
ncbi:MAG: hypothetical protein QOI13_2877 [Paraburkholderia sp.]|nr:hypothetical protein [Paraburkholderia sp.]MEA3122417.1 hypothetical protein [Paraburkholderia sp.]